MTQKLCEKDTNQYYITDGTEVNMLHGSDTTQKAQEELEFFFPVQQTVAVIKPDAYENKGIILFQPVIFYLLLAAIESIVQFASH